MLLKLLWFISLIIPPYLVSPLCWVPTLDSLNTQICITLNIKHRFFVCRYIKWYNKDLNNKRLFHHWEVWMRGNNLLISSLLSSGKNIFFTPPPFFAACSFFSTNSTLMSFPLKMFSGSSRNFKHNVLAILIDSWMFPVALSAPSGYSTGIRILAYLSRCFMVGRVGPGISVISMDSGEIFFTCGTDGQTQTGSGWCRYCPQLTSRPRPALSGLRGGWQ